MTDGKKSGAGPPLENKNAEKWTLTEAKKLFEKCLAIVAHKESGENDYDFIGEVALAAGTYLTQMHDLKKKFPKELGPIYNQIKSCCEANCFRNGKTGKIHAGMAIMNLKSNHQWTDRTETKNINTNQNFNTEISKEEAKKLNDFLEDQF